MVKISAKAAGAALAAVALLAAAGCSGEDPAPSPTASVAAPTLPSGVVQPTALPSNPPDDPMLRENVTIGTCEAGDGGWTASGVAKNPGKEDVEFTITIFFTTESATVLESAQQKVKVKAGGEEKWTATKKFTAPPVVKCVLRAVGTA